jgi:hypothetical protein
MSLLTVLIVLVVVGIVLWGINRAPFIDARMKTVILWVAIAFVVIWLFRALGGCGAMSTVKV